MENDEETSGSPVGSVNDTENSLDQDLVELAQSASNLSAPLTDEPVESVRSQATTDISICEQGPCVNYVKIQRVSELRDGQLMAEHRCSLGVDLMVDRTDQRAKDIPSHLRLLVSPVVFPEMCNQWKPFSDEELEDIAKRRQQGQDRAAVMREAEAARQAAGPLVPMEPAHDIGPDVPDAPADQIPQLPDELEVSDPNIEE